MENIWIQAISTIGLVLIAALQLRAEHQRKKQNEAEEKYKADKEEQRQDDLALQLAQGAMIRTSGELAMVTSKAVASGHVNGEVEKAQTAYLKAVIDYHTQEARIAQKYLKSLKVD